MPASFNGADVGTPGDPQRSAETAYEALGRPRHIAPFVRLTTDSGPSSVLVDELDTGALG
jgi:hypothetical protein